MDGTDNWMKTIRNGDGCVSWSQFEFQFAGPAPWLLSIPLYVVRTDCTDFTLEEAVTAVLAVSAEASTWGSLKAMYR